MKYRHAIILTLAFAVSAGAQTKKAAAKSAGSAEAAIRAADQAWLKATSSHDAGKAAAFVAPDGAMFPPNGPAATTPDAVKKVFEGFNAMKDLKLTWTPTAVMAAASGDLGFSSGTYDMSFMADGKPVHDKGKYVTVWKKQGDGSWKAVRDIFNSDLPAPGSK